jgi:hypothetical protein
LAAENARLRRDNERLRMEREILKNVCAAPFASDFRGLVWSVCDNVFGLRTVDLAKMEICDPGPHKTFGVERHFLDQGSRTPVDCQAISLQPPAIDNRGSYY